MVDVCIPLSGTWVFYHPDAPAVGMADADRIRPTRLLVLVGLLGLIFLLLLVLVVVRFGPEIVGAARVVLWVLRVRAGIGPP